MKLELEDDKTYHQIAEQTEKTFHSRYRGASVTHYLHVAFYHHEELQRESQTDGKSLKWYEQQGWKAMNKMDTSYIENHTTKGAQVGRPKKNKGEQTEIVPKESKECKQKSNEELSCEKEEKELEVSIYSLTVVKLQERLKARGLSTSGVKQELGVRLLVDLQREKIKLKKQTERNEDPLQFKRWWNASIIVSLFKREARRLSRPPKE